MRPSYDFATIMLVLARDGRPAGLHFKTLNWRYRPHLPLAKIGSGHWRRMLESKQRPLATQDPKFPFGRRQPRVTGR
jgi:hypothetical protein